MKDISDGVVLGVYLSGGDVVFGFFFFSCSPRWADAGEGWKGGLVCVWHVTTCVTMTCVVDTRYDMMVSPCFRYCLFAVSYARWNGGMREGVLLKVMLLVARLSKFGGGEDGRRGRNVCQA